MWNDTLTLNRLSAALLVLALLLLAYGAARWLAAQPRFAIRTVLVQATGERALEHVSAERVAQFCLPRINGTFFTTDLAQAKNAFEALPWVRSASVRRQWPDRLVVRLEEHQALARWNDDSGHRFVSVLGESFKAPGEAALGAALPLLTGPEGSEREVVAHYSAFRERLALIGRAPLVVTLSARQAWSLRLADGMVLEIGREQPASTVLSRIERFVSRYAATLGQMTSRVEVVDLRYPNGFAVRAPGLRAAATPKAATSPKAATAAASPKAATAAASRAALPRKPKTPRAAGKPARTRA